ncbi:putative nucleotide-binding alpha-beta plait domain superfamily, RNA-binding domain superfamily [Helianthus debilis subsp. tardiflorus]
MMLWRAFQGHGFVSDAYVARKKDKKGNCFGFIRYVGVENVDLTLVAMNTVKILEAKVSVSLAKYDKNHKKFIYTSKVIGEKTWKPKETMQKNPQYNGAASGGGMVRESLSFASLFQKGNHVNNLGSKTISVDRKGTKYPLHCMGRSIHGVVKDLSTLYSLNHFLNIGGLDNYGLSYIGGLSILLTLGDPGIVKNYMTNYSECLSRVFSRFHVWKGEDLPMESIVNLRIRDNLIFDQIGGLFGMVVPGSSFSLLESDNSESLVLVLIPYGKRIEESVVMKWEDRSYVIWVIEDITARKPDLDGEKPLDDDGEDPEEASDGCSNGGNDEEDNLMDDEVEEGECTPPVVLQPESEGECRPRTESRSIPVNVTSPEKQRLDTERSPNVVETVRDPL